MAALFWLSDEAWAAIEPHLPKNQPGARRVNDGRVLDLSGLREAPAARDRALAMKGTRTLDAFLLDEAAPFAAAILVELVACPTHLPRPQAGTAEMPYRAGAWTPDDQRVLRRLFAEHASIEEIATTLGR